MIELPVHVGALEVISIQSGTEMLLPRSPSVFSSPDEKRILLENLLPLNEQEVIQTDYLNIEFVKNLKADFSHRFNLAKMYIQNSYLTIFIPIKIEIDANNEGWITGSVYRNYEYQTLNEDSFKNHKISIKDFRRLNVLKLNHYLYLTSPDIHFTVC